jgi:hypothetical protein
MSSNQLKRRLLYMENSKHKTRSGLSAWGWAGWKLLLTVTNPACQNMLRMTLRFAGSYELAYENSGAIKEGGGGGYFHFLMNYKHFKKGSSQGLITVTTVWCT